MPATVDHASATEVHLFAYVQATDPGTTGAGKGWVDSSVSPYQLRVRNVSNTGWVDVGITTLPPHKASHLAGASDAFAAGDLLDATARVGVRKNTGGALVGSRREINFIEGSGVSLTVADNAANERIDLTVAMTGSGSGTVTSVDLTVPSFLAVAGNPITTAGTLAVTLATQAANKVFAGPTSGGAATPTWRSLVSADLPAGVGTVTSVGLSLPAQFTVSGSPVTTSGTLTAAWATQTTNKVFAAPNGSTGVPTFRALAAADIPAISLTAGVSGILPPANGGTGVNNGSNALTVPSTGTAALKGVDNAFTSGQGIRTPLTNANAVDAPWQSGDVAGTAGFFGGLAVGNDQVGVTAQSDSNTALYAVSNSGLGADVLSTYGWGMRVISVNGHGIVAYSQGAGIPLYALRQNTGTSGLYEGHIVDISTAGGAAASAGFGGIMTWALQDSTTTSEPASYWSSYWLNPTHISVSSAVGFQVRTGGAPMAEVLQISGSAIAATVPYQFADGSRQDKAIRYATMAAFEVL